jgi:predicted outer membrane repeat protein
MNAVDAGDTTYTDGKEYTKTMTLTKAGDFNLNYRFYASDGSVATGAPTSNSTVSVTNNVPTLNWTGETNYTNDGVDPNSAIAGSSFTFRVKYTDLDNEAPTVYQVWVDADNSGTYESGEKYDMTAVDPGDTTYTDGKLYTKTLTLNTAGSIKYKFVFNDGSDAATGTPASDSTVTVTGSNTPPVLDWTGETGYTSDGVNPDSYSGGTPFTFRVKYTDAENTAPTSIQVWIDENDNSSYEAGEKYNMTAVDPGDTVYSDGKLYTLTRVLNYAGDGVLNYRFYAHDGIDAATGVATSDKTVTVVNPCRVPSGFATIQAAINSVSPACTYILVSDGTYSENISYADKSITIVSVNGAALTKIQGLTTGTTAVVTFGTTVTVSSGVLDGFTIDNQATTTGANTRGISVGSNDSPTIKNCIIEGNNISGGGANGAGISINGGTATIENTTIGTSGKPNSSAGANGAAIYATALSGPLSISNSTIAYNTANLSGGAIYLTGSSSQTTTLTNVTLSNNTATGTNGGAIWSDGPITISGGAITGNSADDNGGAIYLTGASATLNITGTTITGNSTATAATGGGAIYALNSPALTISGATIDSNTGKIGGGLYLTGVTGTSTFTNTSISSNISSTGHAGGIYSNSALSLNNCTINNNTVTDASSDGGGLYLTGGSATITGGTVSGNSSRNGAGIYMQTSSTLNATGTTINYNTGNSAGSGGGIYDSGSTANVTKCNIKGNRVGTDGGGIYNTSGTMTVTSSVITGNTADQQTTNSDGGGIFAGGTTYIYSSTIAGNYATGTGGGLKVTSGTTVTNSIIHSNTSGGAGPNISGSPTVTYTDVQGGFAGAGNIDATPQFINLQQASSGSPTTLGNYHLCNAFGDPDVACTASSPCIDTASATNAPADDIDGQARPYDVAGKGIEGANAYDMGADEYVP